MSASDVAIAPRIDVGIAGNQQPVEPRDNGRGISAWIGRRGQQHGNAAGRLDRLRLGGRQQIGLLNPYAPLRLLAVGRDADQWLRIGRNIAAPIPGSPIKHTYFSNSVSRLLKGYVARHTSVNGLTSYL